MFLTINDKADKSIEKNIDKLSHIDLLRGIAIIMVVITHVALTDTDISERIRSVLIFGKTGVQLFFFLSAYTLCMSMKARNEENSIIKFYIRRFFRIAPLYYIGILIYFILSRISFLNLNGPLSNYSNYNTLNIGLNILFLHSFFSPAYNSIVPGGWSIGTEMLFYVLFPFIFSFYSKIKKRMIYTLPILALIIANIYMVVCYNVKGDEVFTDHYYYAFILNQLPVFTIGITYFFLEKNGLINFSQKTSLICFLLFYTISFFFIKSVSSTITLGVFSAGLAFSGLFIFFKEKNYNFYILNRIGQLSFSIYMFHFFFAYPLSFKVRSLISDNLNAYFVLVINFVISITLSILLALISERLIEKPGIRLGKAVIKANF